MTEGSDMFTALPYKEYRFGMKRTFGYIVSENSVKGIFGNTYPDVFLVKY